MYTEDVTESHNIPVMRVINYYRPKTLDKLVKTQQQHKRRTVTHTSAVNTHASLNSLELFDLSSCDTLLCLDLLQR